VNDQFSSFLDRKQTNYLPNAKGKTKLLLCKKQNKRLSEKKMYLEYKFLHVANRQGRKITEHIYDKKIAKTRKRKERCARIFDKISQYLIRSFVSKVVKM
jgi:hypothetical protein